MLLFAAVVREGGFTRAAERMGLTKQTVSERIAKLEGQLGVRLLERTTRRLRPTDAGAGYYERCAAIAMQVEEANADVRRSQVEPMGLLRVSAPVPYGRRFLAPVVATYLERHPKARIEVVLAARAVDLIEEGFDLAIRIGHLEDSTVAARKLGEAHVYYVASPKLLASRGTPEVKALGSFPCVGVSSSETWLVTGLKVRVAPVLVVNDLDAACEAAIAGVGVAMLPALVCRDAIQRGRLRVLFGPNPAFQPPVHAVFPSRQHLPTKVRIFVEMLARFIEPMRPLELGGRARSAGAPSRS